MKKIFIFLAVTAAISGSFMLVGCESDDVKYDRMVNAEMPSIDEPVENLNR